MIYLYDYAGEPSKTQYWVREVMRRLYSNRPDGSLAETRTTGRPRHGMSSLLWASIPVTPALGQYAIGTPYFHEVRLSMPEGKSFVIRASDPRVPLHPVGTAQVGTGRRPISTMRRYDVEAR